LRDAALLFRSKFTPDGLGYSVYNRKEGGDTWQTNRKTKVLCRG